MRQWISFLVPVYIFCLLMAIVFGMGGDSMKPYSKTLFIVSGVLFGIWLVVRLIIDATARDPMDVFLESQKAKKEQASINTSED
jgi:Na+/H+-dicarboxylate symporter